MNMKVKKGRETITTEIAYIAGFFDGEGCIRIKKANQVGNSYYLWVAITNSNRSILERIKTLFGGKVRYAESSKNKRIYHYLITSSEASDMLRVLSNFLVDKKPQALVALDYHFNKNRMTNREKERACQTITALKK